MPFSEFKKKAFRAMAKKPENTFETKKRIFSASAKLFAMKGYEASSMREIARTADVNLALINYHFKDKSLLLTAVLNHGRKLIIEMFDRHANKELEQMLRALMKDFTDETGAAYYVNIFMRLYLDTNAKLDIKRSITRKGAPKIDVLQKAVARAMNKPEIDCECVLIAHFLFNNLILSSRIKFGLCNDEIKNSYLNDCFPEKVDDPYAEQLVLLARSLTGSVG